MKTAIVFWSATGNTEAMANAIAEAAKAAGAEVDLLAPGDFTTDKVSDYDFIALGCPAMGAEVLEEDKFQPMFDSIKGNLSGKKVALFGSYGWGDGEWMRNWETECRSLGIDLVADPLIINEAPDDDGIAKCAELGKLLA